MNVFSNFVPNKVVTFNDHRSPWIILILKDKFKACVRYFFIIIIIIIIIIFYQMIALQKL